MVDVDSGDVLDRIRLVDGRVVSDTGLGAEFFAGKRAILLESGAADVSDRSLLDGYTDWSNGYLLIRSARDVEAAAGAGEARGLSPEEQAAGLDPVAIQAELAAAQAEVTSQWEDLAEPVTAALVAAVGAALAAGALAALGDLLVPDAAVGVIADAVAAAMVSLSFTAAERAAGELRGQGVDLDPGVPDEVLLRSRADATARLIAQGYAAGAGREALRLAGAGQQAAERGVRDRLDGLTASATSRGFVADHLSAAMFTAEAEGRHASFQQAEGRSGIRFMATEVSDSSTCERCAEIDGTKWESYAEARRHYPGVGFKDCLGGIRCRGRLLVLNDSDRNRAQDVAEGRRDPDD